MTRDDILRMAREAGFAGWLAETPFVTTCFEHFAALVAEREREACAKLCEGLRPSKPEYDQRFNDGCTLSAAAIRARGET